jgi:biotin operon repressor
MATENRGVMVYLPPEIEEYMTNFCTEYKITRKDKEGNILPSLGTGVVTYLKSKISGESPDEILTKPSKSLSNGLSKDEVLDLIREYNTSELPSHSPLTMEAIDTRISTALAPIQDDIERLKQAVSKRVESSEATATSKQPKPEGALTRSEIAEVLGKSRQSIELRRDKGTLEEWGYRAEKSDGNWYYFPIEQLDQPDQQ